MAAVVLAAGASAVAVWGLAASPGSTRLSKPIRVKLEATGKSLHYDENGNTCLSENAHLGAHWLKSGLDPERVLVSRLTSRRRTFCPCHQTSRAIGDRAADAQARSGETPTSAAAIRSVQPTRASQARPESVRSRPGPQRSGHAARSGSFCGWCVAVSTDRGIAIDWRLVWRTTGCRGGRCRPGEPKSARPERAR